MMEGFYKRLGYYISIILLLVTCFICINGYGSVGSYTTEGANKIDNQAVNGFTGVQNSLAYKTAVIEGHLLGAGSWFEKAASPSGEVNVADRIGEGNGSFQLDAGNDTWGAWVQILGSGDTPARQGFNYFDPHELLIEATEHTATYFLQFARGSSGEAAYTAGTYTELVVGSDSNRFKEITQFKSGRAPVGSKLWARVMCPGQNTSTINFYIGMHQYEN